MQFLTNTTYNFQDMTQYVAKIEELKSINEQHRLEKMDIKSKNSTIESERLAMIKQYEKEVELLTNQLKKQNDFQYIIKQLEEENINLLDQKQRYESIIKELEIRINQDYNTSEKSIKIKKLESDRNALLDEREYLKSQVNTQKSDQNLHSDSESEISMLKKQLKMYEAKCKTLESKHDNIFLQVTDKTKEQSELQNNTSHYKNECNR